MNRKKWQFPVTLTIPVSMDEDTFKLVQEYANKNYGGNRSKALRSCFFRATAQEVLGERTK